MTRFKRKPVFINAWQWNETNSMLDEMKACGLKWSGNTGHRDRPDECRNLKIRTNYGSEHVEAGQWVFIDEDGDWRIFADEKFAENFELADEMIAQRSK